MLKKLKDILNTYSDKELLEIDLWVNSNNLVETIIIDEYNIDLITEDKITKIENNEVIGDVKNKC